MAKTIPTNILAAGMGAVAGMRSMSAPALLSRALAAHQQPPQGGAARLLTRPFSPRLLTVIAAGEMAADKTSFIPDRTEPMAVGGRALSGALTGAAVAQKRGSYPLGAALIGSAAAVGATFLAYNLRKIAGQVTGLPDALIGLAEDALVLTAGSRIARAVA